MEAVVSDDTEVVLFHVNQTVRRQYFRVMPFRLTSGKGHLWNRPQ